MSDEHVDPDETGDGEVTRLALGPQEIIDYPLRKATRGYRTDEVDDLLDQLAVQTQDLFTELQRLEEERDLLRQQLADASETESMLKKTLVTAQRAAEASVAEAREEADELRARATERVEQLLGEAAEQAHQLRDAALRRARAAEADIRHYRRDVEEHIEDLRTFAADHRARLAHHLERQRERLDEMDLPDAPPIPHFVEDEILDEDLDEVDVQEILAELIGSDDEAEDLVGLDQDVADDDGADARADAEDPHHAEDPHGPEDAGDAEDAGEGDEASGGQSDDDEQPSKDDVDTGESLFGS